MANTERIRVLEIVNEAYDDVVDAQYRSGLSKVQRRALESAELALYRLSNRLVGEINRAFIADLRQQAGGLGRLVGRMRKDVKGLKQVARNVERAAEAVRILATVLESGARLAVL